MTKTLLKNINSIPALPESIQAVERVYQDENSTFQDMQQAIEKDPLLTADLIRVVNSPMYGMVTQITDVKRAISLLGKESVRTFILANAANSFTIDLSPYNMKPEEFKVACDKQLALMINWVARRNPKSLAQLGPASFLVDLGRIIISKTLIEDGKAKTIQEAIAKGSDVSQAEKKACGAQTTDVTATLFRHWNFDPNIIHIIRYSDDPEGTIDEDREMAAKLKVVRETILPNGDITEESIANAKETIEEFELDLVSYEKALEKILNS
ncbi:MAG: HDOD domain-containing protein [Campylobacterota bacterium]|nr:HDOD domain-containing protein [Campylobacterota bacterium]